MDEAKRELRARIRGRRASAATAPDAAARRAAQADGLLQAALDGGLLDPHGRPGLVGPVVIAAYLASPDEPEVAAIRDAVRAAGGRVLLPIPLPDRELAWADDDGHHAEVTRLRVLAPTGTPVGTGAACLARTGVRVVLVPALAVDEGGTRLGQGGGYYDVVLAGLAAADDTPMILAVVGDDEVMPAGQIPREAHDAAVTAALTPSGVRRLG
jgi:5-formyltetrahydrofolate cyclo-ligase